MKVTLDFIHQLERMQIEMRLRDLSGAARSLEPIIEFLRHEYDLSVIKFENAYANRVGYTTQKGE
jgi:hypothetical protein